MAKEGLGSGWYSEGSNNLVLPCPEYQHAVHIAKDALDGHRIAIRKWIERNTDETVILTYLDLRYYYNWGRRYSDHGYQVSHGYHQFYFEESTTALAFGLAFTDVITHEPMLYSENNVPHRETRYLLDDGSIETREETENVSVAHEQERKSRLYNHRGY